MTEPPEDDDLFAPAPIALDDQALRTLGVIAVQSARLEWFLVGLHSILDKSKTHEQHMAVRARDHVKAITSDLARYEGVGPLEEAVRWAQEAESLLVERGNVMHSGWVVDEATGTLESHHVRSGDRQPFSQVALDNLAERLGIHVSLGPAYWMFAIMARDQEDLATDQDDEPR